MSTIVHASVGQSSLGHSSLHWSSPSAEGLPVPTRWAEQKGTPGRLSTLSPGQDYTIALMVNPHDTPGGAPAGGLTTGSQENVRYYPNAKGSYAPLAGR